MKVWVVSASKHGSTTEIATAICDRLTARGYAVERKDVVDVRDFHDADAVVFGSAVYAGRWLPAAAELMHQHGAELADRPTWLFSSGPVGDPPKPDPAEPVETAETIELTRARGHVVFAGKIDRSRLNVAERLIVKALRAPTGDFRDWGCVSGWADEIADELDSLAPRRSSTAVA